MNAAVNPLGSAFLALLLGTTAIVVPARAGTIEVTIDGLTFAPVEIEAKVGDEVEWINKDALVHTATMKGGTEVLVPAKKSGRLLMNEPGSFDYICRYHPNMKGHITVRP
ncbi:MULTISPECIES: cupredoxin family copper-binding protein [unclassified Sinorhizobium]|uniref:cupredoxin domain-containing protein n=1 Tax=unclassified Sinorhizobium TaxID=2613772 RepID=UPI0024C3CF81|nr:MULTISPECIES: cupredoxin family copper-binding protein [unclassified Sinorhizobium]MDK1374278.1 cupredoxin family copper-binding protein [Sinorhizobium sp. 6-70]MDK1479422.1 cupredoxin family copper-binding protein [Sinorhizobium sp. 6-117]